MFTDICLRGSVGLSMAHLERIVAFQFFSCSHEDCWQLPLGFSCTVCRTVYPQKSSSGNVWSIYSSSLLFSFCFVFLTETYLHIPLLSNDYSVLNGRYNFSLLPKLEAGISVFVLAYKKGVFNSAPIHRYTSSRRFSPSGNTSRALSFLHSKEGFYWLARHSSVCGHSGLC